MNPDKKKILEDTERYLKFYKVNSNYVIYESEIRGSEKINSFLGPDKEDIISKEEEFPVVKSVTNSSVKKVKEIRQDPDPELNTERGELFSATVSQSKFPADENWMKSKTFDEFSGEIKDCGKCRLLSSTRKQVVFGTGNPDADVVVVGEAPGADEDEQGKPFVGRAGKLLTEILNAINFTREEIFICNILKCRPPENRNPLPDEIENCEPYLFKQLEMIKPKLILAVGTFAAQTLLKSKEPLGKLRGKFHDYKGIKMMVTYHPAALLRNPNWKRPTWEDVQQFRKEYDKIVNS